MNEITLSCFSYGYDRENRDEQIIEAKRMQTSIFSRFTAKRGAGRIERYFVKHHSLQIGIAIQLIAFSLVSILLVLYIYVQSQTLVHSLTATISEMALPIHTHLFQYTAGLLFEAYFFANIPPVFFQYFSNESHNDQIFHLSQYQYRALINGHQDFCYLHSCGLSTGSIVATEYISSSPTKKVNSEYLIWYSNVSKPGNRSPICSFRTNNQMSGINLSFPYEGDCLQFPFSVLDRPWYQYGVTLAKPTWTSIYYNIHSIPVIATVSPSFDQNNHVNAVFSSEIKIQTLQELFLKKMPGKHSRFALISELGHVLAVTGNDDPIDFYKGEIVTKTLLELRDPIWIQITKLMQEVSGIPNSPNLRLKNMTTKIEVNNQDLDYIITITNFTSSPGRKWSVLNAICASDMFEAKLQNPKNIYFSSTLLLFAGFVLAALFRWFFEYLIGLEQNRLLTAKTGTQSKHLKQTGIQLALDSLKKLMKSHADNIKVLETVTKVVDDIQTCRDSLYFSRNKFYSEIGNEVLRKKFIAMYGGEDDTSSNFETEFDKDLSSDDSFEMDSNFGKKNDLLNDTNFMHLKGQIPLQTTTEHPVSNVNNTRIKLKDQKNSNSNISSFADISIGASLSIAQRESFRQRYNTLKLNREQSISLIKSIFRKCNSSRQRFDNFRLMDLLDNLIFPLITDDSLLNLLADAIEFDMIILQWKVQQQLVDADLAFSILIATLIWQVHMRNRRKSNRQMINRYFVTNSSKLNRTAKDILMLFYTATITSDSHNIKFQIRPKVKTTDNEPDSESVLELVTFYDDGSEYDTDDNGIQNDDLQPDHTSDIRWNKIVTVIIEILQIAPINMQPFALSQIQLEAKILHLIKKRNIKESIDMLRVMFIGSTLSFFFHDSESSREARKRPWKTTFPDSNNDLSSSGDLESSNSDQKNTLFLTCLSHQFIPLLKNGLEVICGRPFVSHFEDSYNQMD